MLREEYEKLAKRKVSAVEYGFIEKLYMADEGIDKASFVKAFISDKNGMQTKVMEQVDAEIEKRCAEARAPYAEKILSYEENVRKLKVENARLDRELEAELEYKPYEKSNMSDEDYMCLLNCCITEAYDVEQATRFIASEFGFDESKIEVLFEVEQCKIDRHLRIHNVGVKERAPMYASSDWNYVRFDVVDMCFECVNGNLYIL